MALLALLWLHLHTDGCGWRRAHLVVGALLLDFVGRRLIVGPLKATLAFVQSHGHRELHSKVLLTLLFLALRTLNLLLLILLLVNLVEAHQVHHIVVIVFIVVRGQLRIICRFFILLGRMIFFILVFDTLVNFLFALLVRLSVKNGSLTLDCPLQHTLEAFLIVLEDCADVVSGCVR